VIRLLALLTALLASPAGAEVIVAGLSQNRVAITANFDGSEILVYGAVRRDAPAPDGPLDVIITVEGPATPVTVRRKSRVFGIWINTASVQVARAPTFYAIAATAPVDTILSETENLRHKITIPRAIRAVGITEEADDAPGFTEALIRLNRTSGAYVAVPDGVTLADDTLFRTDIVLPANLTEGEFRVRVFLLRGGAVVDKFETPILVQKEGLERMMHTLAFEQPLIYGFIALLIAVVAGWAASAAFRALRV